MKAWTKHCGGCNTDKELESFGFLSASSSDIDYRCKECRRGYARAYRARKRIERMEEVEWIETLRKKHYEDIKKVATIKFVADKYYVDNSLLVN